MRPWFLNSSLFQGAFVLLCSALMGCGQAHSTQDSNRPSNSPPGSVDQEEEEMLPFPMNEVCEDADYEPICYGSSARDCFLNGAYIPSEPFCEHFSDRCFEDIPSFEEQFSRCDEPEFSYSDCEWSREIGCGFVRYVEPTDESSSYSIFFDAETEQFRGLILGSDDPYWCDRHGIMVGDRSLFESGAHRSCDGMTVTFCCRR